MPYIIDGNNLIGCSPDISLGDPEAREKILRLIKKFQESKNTMVTVVFDGEPGSVRPLTSAKFRVLFPKYGSSADDEIKKILDHYAPAREATLVSSDQALKLFAKRKGIQSMNCTEFYYQLKKTNFLHGKREETLKRIHDQISPNEVEHWLKIFKRDR